MSIEAASAVSQLIPVLLLAFVIDMTVNPKLKGRSRVLPAISMTIVVGLPAVTEIVLVNAVINDSPLADIWSTLSLWSVVLLVALIAAPHVFDAWGLMPYQRGKKGEATE